MVHKFPESYLDEVGGSIRTTMLNLAFAFVGSYLVVSLEPRRCIKRDHDPAQVFHLSQVTVGVMSRLWAKTDGSAGPVDRPDQLVEGLGPIRNRNVEPMSSRFTRGF